MRDAIFTTLKLVQKWNIKTFFADFQKNEKKKNCPYKFNESDFQQIFEESVLAAILLEKRPFQSHFGTHATPFTLLGMEIYYKAWKLAYLGAKCDLIWSEILTWKVHVLEWCRYLNVYTMVSSQYIQIALSQGFR